MLWSPSMRDCQTDGRAIDQVAQLGQAQITTTHDLPTRLIEKMSNGYQPVRGFGARTPK